MTVKALRIRDWETHFENNRSRDRKRLDWVPVPNKHDGDGFSELLDHADGMAHYGAWMLIVQVASKCDTRGTLLRDGRQPYDARSLARVTRGSQKKFEEAIPRLLSIGWLEEIAISEIGLKSDNPAPGCGNPAPGCPEEKRREENRKEGKGREAPAPAPLPPADPPDAHVPSESEFLDAFMNDGIPLDYLRKQWRWFNDNNAWLNQYRRLVNWQGKVRSRWAEDRATWRGPHSRNGRDPNESVI